MCVVEDEKKLKELSNCRKLCYDLQIIEKENIEDEFNKSDYYQLVKTVTAVVYL